MITILLLRLRQVGTQAVLLNGEIEYAELIDDDKSKSNAIKKLNNLAKDSANRHYGAHGHRHHLRRNIVHGALNYFFLTGIVIFFSVYLDKSSKKPYLASTKKK